MAAVVNTDGTRMLGELLEETSDLGLGSEKVSLRQIEGVLFQMRYPAFGKSITKCFRTKILNCGAILQIAQLGFKLLVDKMAHSLIR